MKLVGLDHVALSVANVERAVEWYVDVLGFERMHPGEWAGVPSFVGIGGTGLALFPKRERQEDVSEGVRHVAFRATGTDFLNAQRELRSREISFQFEDHGIAHSIYFCDPDGNRLEITTYEVE